MQSKLHPKFSESQIEACLQRVAEAVRDDDELMHILKLVKDPKARTAARARMKPFLKFTPKEEK